MKNDFRNHPVCKTLPLWLIYSMSAKGINRLMSRRDKPAPRTLNCD